MVHSVQWIVQTACGGSGGRGKPAGVSQEAWGAHLCGSLRLPRAQQRVCQAVADGLVLPGRLHVAQAQLNCERLPEVALCPTKGSSGLLPPKCPIPAARSSQAVQDLR